MREQKRDPSDSTQDHFLFRDSPSGMALVDLNGDGKPDVVTVNRSGNKVSVKLHR